MEKGKENSSWKCGKDSSTKEERKEVLSITNLRQKENKASGVPVLRFTERERKKEREKKKRAARIKKQQEQKQLAGGGE